VSKNWKRAGGAALVAPLLAVGLLSGSPAMAITGGSPVPDGAYRFIAKIDNGETSACTGILVAPRWVLTAKACLTTAANPGAATKAVIGRAHLENSDGPTLDLISKVVHPTANLALGELESPVTDIKPARIATAAPVQGEVLKAAGYGRTETEWATEQLQLATFEVSSVAATTIGVVGRNPAAATTCKGDAGGPAFREKSAIVEVVALHDSSWQNGCFGETETRHGAVETRLDTVAAWITANTPQFATGLEAGQPQLSWPNNTVESAKNVGGVCCNLTGAELFVGPTSGRSASRGLLYSGRDSDTTASYAYTKGFALKAVKVTATTKLSYWIYPESHNAQWGHADGSNSTCVALDLVFADGSAALRDTGAKDERGFRAHPAHQCGHLTMDAWNQVVVPLGGVANGKEISQIHVGYDQPANIGGYRGFIDDISISR
jgi:hypothetical protein